MSTTAYSYIRFSSAKQSDGDSTRRQIEARDQFISRHGLTLDTKLKMVEAGVSAFRGKHRDHKTCLGQFVKLVHSGSIPKGSYLILENLDRLSREDADEALQLLLSLTSAGILVVQLQPVEVVFKKPVQMMQLMMAIMELSRGNSESEMKRVRSSANWTNKHNQARTTLKAQTAKCPFWLRREGDKFVQIEDKVQCVRMMFRMTIEGYTPSAIIRELEKAHHLPPNAKEWSAANMHHILKGRQVLGEYQPTKDNKVVGDPIPGYYPTVITEEEFYKAKAAVARRRTYTPENTRTPQGGRSAKKVNLFAGIIFNAVDGDSLVFKTRASTDPKRKNVSVYVNKRSDGAKTPYTAFPVVPLETGVLSFLKEINPLEILPGQEPVVDMVGTLTRDKEEKLQQLREIEQQLIKPKAAVAQLANAATALTEQLATINEKLCEARDKASNPHTASWNSCLSLIETLNSAPDLLQARHKLSMAIHRVVSRMDCLFLKEGFRSIALVQLRFFGSDEVRTVSVQYRGELRNVKERVPPYIGYKALDQLLPQGSDITDPDERKRLTKLHRPLLQEEQWVKLFEPTRIPQKQKIAENAKLRRELGKKHK